MKYPSKNWPTYTVQFWTTTPLKLGNSRNEIVKARSESEAKRLAIKRFGALHFGVVRIFTKPEKERMPQEAPSLPEFTQAQVEAWIDRNDFNGSIRAARVAIEDARTLHLA